MNTVSSEPSLQLAVGLWIAVAILILIRHVRPGRSVGLVLSYVLSLAAIHWFASALFLLPWHDNADRDLSIVGLRESLFAIIALWVGCELGGKVRVGDDPQPSVEAKQVPPRLVNLYILTGLAMYSLLFTSVASIPSASAVLSGGSALMAAGLCLKCWNAQRAANRAVGRLWLAAAFTFPVITIIVQGFIGYGFAALTIVLAFRSSWQRLTLQRVAFGLIVAFVGLSVYATYMRDRGLIREVVWSGGRFEERTRQLTETLSSFEWFDFTNDRHLARVNVRLNQNYFVGAAVAQLNDGLAEFAYGATIKGALISLIPRAIWSGKSGVAGSGDLVSTYTGIQFAEGTSVGIGHVLEFYVNFGRPGVLVGFIVLGFILVRAERHAIYHLNRGDSHRFLLWYLPTLNLLQVGGSFAEITAGAGAALLLAHGINWGSRHLWRPVPYSFPAPIEQEGVR